ncbi:unnamed protein product [Microthlaspi erraticum]|uniref:Reverse transcriptase zinc-binding domain-containing protein n=1 Tax=Microthlaspi erraticum TaxID=1685480 RepID=A0A6D2I878_9BRAS|nr:unnamed protein product [Microthlaspi erraticum]
MHQQGTLAKLSWKILNNPTSLLARVLLGKYCKDQPILDVPLSSSASHGWRGVLIGRDLLVEQLGKSIGNGQNTLVWNDSWLSLTSPPQTDRPTKPAGPKAFGIRPSRSMPPRWNKGKVEELLPQYAADILCMRPSTKGAQDSFVWLPSKTGEYTAKTGYHVARAREFQPEDHNHPQLNWIKDVWSGKFSSKLKVFIWKIIQMALPLGENLLSRGLWDNACCTHCGDLETAEHLFFLCPFARKTWDLAPTTVALEISTTLDFTSIFIQSKVQFCLPPTGINAGPLFPWVCWAILSTRNHKIFEDRSFSPEETILKAITDAKEWQFAQTLENPGKGKGKTFKPYEMSREQIVVFTDGAWNPESKIAGA